LAIFKKTWLLVYVVVASLDIEIYSEVQGDRKTTDSAHLYILNTFLDVPSPNTIGKGV
jgi:hypothetical protein